MNNIYFKNGQNWGDEGIQKVLEDIYKLNKREELLNNFIDEAIKKIKYINNYQSQKKLPQFLEED